MLCRKRLHTVLWLGWLARLVLSVVNLLGFTHLLLIGQAIMSIGFAVMTVEVTCTVRQPTA